MVGESDVVVTIMNRRLIELYAINTVKSIQRKPARRSNHLSSNNSCIRFEKLLMISSIYYNHHHFISNSSQLFDFILYVPLLPLSVEISGELQELCLLIRSRNTDHNEKPEK